MITILKKIFRRHPVPRYLYYYIVRVYAKNGRNDGDDVYEDDATVTAR